MKWIPRRLIYCFRSRFCRAATGRPRRLLHPGSEEKIRQLHERIGALEGRLQRQNREFAELRAKVAPGPAPAPGPSRQLRRLCERSFGPGIASVLGITESPDAGAAVGEIRIDNLAVQGGNASGRAEARIMHYNDGRWLLKSIRLYATDGARYSVRFRGGTVGRGPA